MEFLAQIVRKLNHHIRLRKFTSPEDILPGIRIVNRALYGTDYDPDEVGINNLPRRVNLCC